MVYLIFKIIVHLCFGLKNEPIVSCVNIDRDDSVDGNKIGILVHGCNTNAKDWKRIVIGDTKNESLIATGRISQMLCLLAKLSQFLGGFGSLRKIS